MFMVSWQICLYYLTTNTVFTFGYGTHIFHLPVYIVGVRTVGFCYKKVQLLIMSKNISITKNHTQQSISETVLFYFTIKR